MAKPRSRQWIIAIASFLGATAVISAIPLFGYLALRLDLSLKASSIGKPPRLDEPVTGSDLRELPVFSAFKEGSDEEKLEAMRSMRQRYRDLLSPPPGEEKAKQDWNGLERWNRQWVPMNTATLPPGFPESLEKELEEVASFLRRPDADFCFGEPGQSADSGAWNLATPIAIGVLPDMIAAHFLRGVMRLEAGHSAKALEEVETLLDYGKFALQRPCTHTLMLQRRAYEQAIRLVWEGLHRGAWTRGELGVLRMRFGYLKYFKGADEALRGEVFYQKKLDEARFTIQTGVMAHLTGQTFQRRHQQTYLHWIKPILTEEPDWVSRYLLEEWQAEPEGLTALKIITGHANPAARSWLLRTILRMQMLITAADTACALEIYRQENGHFPESLDALKASHIVTDLPPDPIDGDSLLYRRETSGGYLLWSLGWNLADDQGTAVFDTDKEGKPTERLDLAQGDWLWKMPPVK